MSDETEHFPGPKRLFATLVSREESEEDPTIFTYILKSERERAGYDLINP